MGRIELAQLIADLRDTDSLAPAPWVDEAYCLQSNFLTKPRTQVFYVPPHLLVAEDSSAGSPFLLLSAPAAVGKTSLAGYLHTYLAVNGRIVLYVPMKGLVIGHNFFGGLLSKAFPRSTREDALAALFSGRVLLLFDGYDEVSMSSAQIELNQLFASELSMALAEFESKGKKARPCILFLFRSVFRELGVFDAILPRSREIGVDFFDAPERRDYLAGYLANRNFQTGDARKKLVGTFLDAFEEILGPAKREAAAFFGHAIVLSAFGDYLLEQQEQNALRIANEMSRKDARETYAVNILAKVINIILERETEKFPNSDFISVAQDFDGYPASLQEQLLVCVAEALARRENPIPAVNERVSIAARDRLETQQAFKVLPESARKALSAKYCDELQQKLAHHPFLDSTYSSVWTFRNPIYFEFYLAKVLARPQESVAPYFASNNAFSFYLALFALAEIPNRDLSAVSTDFFYFLAHLLSSAASDSEVDVLLEVNADSGAWIGEVSSDDLSVEPFRYQSEILVLRIPSGGRLRNVQLISEFGHPAENGFMISISAPPGSDPKACRIEIADSHLVGSEIELDSPAIKFSGAFLDTPRLVFSERVAELEGVESLSICGQHDVEIRGSNFFSNAWHAKLTGRVQTPGAELDELRQLLERVLLWFRKHKRAEFGMYDKRFNTIVLRKGRDEQMVAFTDFLFQRAILERAGHLIILNQKVLSGFGVAYVQQNSLQVDEALAQPLGAAWVAARDG